MSVLIILRGNSGSGKTTVAKALQRRFGRGTLLLSQDTVRREMLWAKDGGATEALPLLQALLTYGSAHCQVVILEGILNSRWYRPLFILAKELYGEQIFAYYYDLPFAETLRRHQTRPQRMEFGEEAMWNWWMERDYLDVLPEVTLGQELSAEETVERIFVQVAGSGAVKLPTAEPERKEPSI